jgi:hypothetical protein
LYSWTDCRDIQITAIDADDISHWKMELLRNIPTMLREEAESMIQRVLHARDDVTEDIEKRDEFEACPFEVDSTHPLW